MPITSISEFCSDKTQVIAGGDRSPPAVVGRRRLYVLLVELIGADSDVGNGLDDGVMTSAAVDDVVSAAAARNRVVAGTAQDCFASQAAEQGVVTSAAIQSQMRTLVDQIEGGDDVITCVAVDGESVVLAVVLDDDPRRQSVDDQVAVLD